MGARKYRNRKAALHRLTRYCRSSGIEILQVIHVHSGLAGAVTKNCGVLICRRLCNDVHAILFGLEWAPLRQRTLLEAKIKNSRP